MSLWVRFLCVFSCKGVYPMALFGLSLKPCPRCGRVRFIA